jgi:cysteine synthase
MSLVDRIDEVVLEKTARLCRERQVLIPTFAELRDPSRVPAAVKRRLAKVGLWDVDPVNLFRISWHNEPVERGGLYNRGNWLELPSALTGVSARIVGLVGKWFPTGAHKVGAAFGCLVPQLVTGAFDPATQKAVWPSTGNFCRGGAFDSALLACKAVAILPEGMSKERFEWLRRIGTDEIIATPGSESNVKEIYDMCWKLRKERGTGVAIFNQFEELGNAAWHYWTTGGIVEEVFEQLRGPRDRLAAWVSSTGSAGTIAAGDYLKRNGADVKVAASEALQCPTLLANGFGAHRIEGIGDKHVPWVHNVRNTDLVVAVDDAQPMALMRLFNEDAGRGWLEAQGVPRAVVDRLPLLGISGIANVVSAIKLAKYYELGPRDVIFLPLTDSMDLYGSRLDELRAAEGPYGRERASADFARHLVGCEPAHVRELGYPDRKALHNLKYFTWVEQQGRTVDELHRLWDPDYWTAVWTRVEEWDKLIVAFNDRTGVARELH